MKLNFKNFNNNIARHKYLKLDKNKQNAIKKYNTRPAQAISFGGSAVSMSEKFVKSGVFNKLINFVADNEAAYNAIYSLLIAGIIKPFAVLAMPRADEKDKQMIATKNFLQAFLGSFLSMTIGGGLIKKSVDIIQNNLSLIKYENIIKDGKEKIILTTFDKNSKEAISLAKKVLQKENKGGFLKPKKTEFNVAEIEQKAASLVSTAQKHINKYYKKNPEFVQKLIDSAKDKKSASTLMDAYVSCWKNSTGALTAIAKAKISSVLLPGVMVALFAKRNLENKKKQQIKESLFTNSSQYQKEKAQYSVILNSSPSFKGNALNTAIEGLAGEVEKISMTKPGEKFVKGLSNLPGCLNKPSARMSDIESFLLTGYWVQNTIRSKKIEPEQKLGFNLNTVLVTIVSSLCAFGIDTFSDILINKAKNAYSNVITNAYESIKDKNNITKAKEQLKESCKKLINSDEIINSLIKDNKLLSEAEIKSTVSKLANSYSKKLSKFKSLTIFTLVVRFLVPVLMVPVSGTLKSKILDRKKQKKQAPANVDKK